MPRVHVLTIVHDLDDNTIEVDYDVSIYKAQWMLERAWTVHRDYLDDPRTEDHDETDGT